MIRRYLQLIALLTLSLSAASAAAESAQPPSVEALETSKETPDITGVSDVGGSAQAPATAPSEKVPQPPVAVEEEEAAQGEGPTQQASPAEQPTGQAGVGAETEEWLKSLYLNVADAVVRVETDRGVGTGFAFHSRSHVATAFHVIEDAEKIQVVTLTGAVIPAKVAAHDRQLDLAILELALPLRGVPVLESAAEFEIGDPVAAIGHPMSLYQHSDQRLKGLLDWTLTQGIIGAVSEHYVQTDTAVNPGNSGGPLLAPDGRVVGVISFQLRKTQGVNVAVRARELTRLIERLGRQAPPRKNHWEREAIELGFVGHYGERTLRGLGLGIDITGYKKLALMGRVALLNGSGAPDGSFVINRVVDRTSLEFEAAYRMKFSPSSGLTLGVGGAFQFERTDTWILNVRALDPTCTTDCLLVPTTTVSREKTFRPLPMLTGSLTFFPIRISYAYQLDPSAIDESIHRLFVGLAL